MSDPANAQQLLADLSAMKYWCSVSPASVWAERVRERGGISLDSAPLPDSPPHELADITQVIPKLLPRQVHGGRERTNYKAKASVCARTLLLLCATLTPLRAQENSVAVLTDGSRMTASLTGISQNWQTSWSTAEGERRLEASQLVRWGEARDNQVTPMIVLAGGSSLRGQLLELNQRDVVWASTIFGEIKFARRLVRGIIWRPPFNVIERDQMVGRLGMEKRNQDLLLTVNGDELAGTVMSEQRDETPAEPTRLSVMIQAGSDPISAEIDNLVALAMRSDAAKLPVHLPYGVVATRTGDVLWAMDVTTHVDHVEFRLLEGTVVPLTSDGPWSQITSIQLFQDSVTYVSDMPDRSHKHIPFLSLAWDYGNDRNVSGGWLRYGGKIYRKGIGMHSVARLACPLAGKYRRFESEVAIDDSVGAQGSVIFRVYVERSAANNANATWEVAYESPVVRGGEPALAVSVDVQNVQRLALVVDSADRGDESDHANWLDARLIR
jgi:hypothetical protein